MSIRPLLPGQPVTVKGDMPSQVLLEIIDRMAREIQSLRERVAALEAP